MYVRSRGLAMSSDDEKVYSRGTLSTEQIRDEINIFWHDLEISEDSALEAELQAAGFDRAMLANVDPESAITVQAGTSGADPISVLIIIAFAPTANRVMKDIWTTAVLPRIRRRWGEDAIGEERQSRT
jgi:hypothetical protein